MAIIEIKVNIPLTIEFNDYIIDVMNLPRNKYEIDIKKIKTWDFRLERGSSNSLSPIIVKIIINDETIDKSAINEIILKHSL